MSAFVSQTDVASTGSSTSITLPSFTVIAGERLHGWFTYGNGTPLTESITDTGGNTWSKVGSSASDGGNGQSECQFECLSAAGGTYNITANLNTSAPFLGFRVARYSGLDTSGAGQGAAALVNSPGSGANAVGPGNITPSAQPGRGVGVVMDSSGTGEPSLTPTTGWTDRGAMSNIESAFGVKTRTEDKAITSTSAFAATFTAGSGSGNFLCVGYYTLDAGVGSASIAGSRRKKTPIHPGPHPSRFFKNIKTLRNKTTTSLATITGTAAPITGGDVDSASGNASITGSAAALAAYDLSAATGYTSPIQGSRRAKTPVHPGSGPYNLLRFKKSTRNTTIAAQGVTGVAASLLGDALSAGTGSLSVIGSAEPLTQGDRAAAAGAQTVTGSAAGTAGQDISSAAGTTKVTGSATPEARSDTPVASGNVSIPGSAAAAAGSDLSSGSGSPSVSGQASPTLDADYASAQAVTVPQDGSRKKKNLNHPGNGPVGFSKFRRTRRNISSALAALTGAGASVGLGDTSSATGAPAVSGSTAAILSGDSAAASGAPTVIGTAADTMAGDAAVSSGSPRISAVAASVLGADKTTASGNPIVSGSASPILASDTPITAAGNVGAASPALGNDQASAAGNIGVTGFGAAVTGDSAGIAVGTVSLVGLVAALGSRDFASAFGLTGITGFAACRSGEDFMTSSPLRPPNVTLPTPMYTRATLRTRMDPGATLSTPMEDGNG